MTFNPEKFKQQFPLFSQPENSELVYLDNAATTQRPQQVIDAVTQFYLSGNANTHRSSHRLARKATEMVEVVRNRAADFLGAAQSDEIIFTRGATEALNLLAFSLTESLDQGDEIILTAAEHHANLVPWQMAAQRHGLVLRFIPSVNGVPQIKRLTEVLSEKTRIVSLTAASNALGFYTDLSGIKREWTGRDIIWCVDAAQLAAHQKIDVQSLGCDFLVCSAHKFYGPTGVGLLYGKRERLAVLPPWQGGGEMIERVELEKSTYTAPPHRFETGTSSLAAIAGLNGCFDFWQVQDRAAMQLYEKQLCSYLHQRLNQIEKIKVHTHPEGNVGIATFSVDDTAAQDAVALAHWLDGHDIAVRVGRHCAMPLMAEVSGDATVRVSLAAYNTNDDIDRLVSAIQSALQGEPELLQSEVGELSIETLQAQKGWQPRYRMLMKWAEFIHSKPEIRKDENLLTGCEANTWITHLVVDGCHRFFIDSGARVVKGLAALLLVLIDGKSTEQIDEVDLAGIFTGLELDGHLSASRNNGFKALVDKALLLVKNFNS